MVILFVISMLLLGIVLPVAWFINKARRQKLEEHQAMEQFQRDMEREFDAKDRVSPIKGTIPFAESRFPSPEEKAPMQPSPPPTPPNIFSDPTPQQETVSSPRPFPLTEQIIMRIKEANLFESSEGPYFPLDPSGECVLIRLKQKKTALLVPRFESQHFIQNTLKRFDYVFLILSKDEVIVLNSFSGFIAGHFKLS